MTSTGTGLSARTRVATDPRRTAVIGP